MDLMGRRDDQRLSTPASGGFTEPIEPVAFRPVDDRAHLPKKRGRLAGMAVIVALCMVCAVAWYLFTVRSVAITTQPAEAALVIEDVVAPSLGGRYLLRPGNYRLRAEAPGYRLLDTEFRVGEDRVQAFSFVLEPLPGHLRVNSTPITGARVFIDGRVAGETPTIVPDLAPGRYTVLIEGERYLPVETEVAIEGYDVEQTLAVALAPAWAEVTLASVPEHAEVQVDDKTVGTTPLTTQILQGPHRITVTLPGRKRWLRRVEITAGEPQSFTDIVLPPADSVLVLQTHPAHANVTIDGVYVGQTPLETMVEPGKSVEIDLFKDGYQQASRRLTGKSGKRQTLRLDLKPELAEVQFVVNPPDAELIIDGESRGKAAQTFKLPAHAHEIVIRKPGYIDYDTRVTPRAGAAQEIAVRLKTLEQARRESIKPIVETPNGHTLQLMRPHPFIMGASRREPGRRANEVVRNIKLTRPYYLARHEVTNAQFRAFLNAHNSGHVNGHSLNGEAHPAVNVDWNQAALYCNWLSKRDQLPTFYVLEDAKVVGFNTRATGYRLPTEAEWAWAARVEGGGKPLKYPWGYDMPPRAGSGNYADAGAADLLARTISDYNDDYSVTAPVGSFAPNSKGLFDLGGNAAEWVHDFYDPAGIDLVASGADLMGPKAGQFHVIRGSSWAHGTITELRLSFRDYGDTARDDVGFRIARFVE